MTIKNTAAYIAAISLGASVAQAQVPSFIPVYNGVLAINPAAVNDIGNSIVSGNFTANIVAGTITTVLGNASGANLTGGFATPAITFTGANIRTGTASGPVLQPLLGTVSGPTPGNVFGFPAEQSTFAGALSSFPVVPNTQTTYWVTVEGTAGAFTGTLLQGSFQVVPEPETYAAVAALGLVGFGLWRRRSA